MDRLPLLLVRETLARLAQLRRYGSATGDDVLVAFADILIIKYEFLASRLASDGPDTPVSQGTPSNVGWAIVPDAPSTLTLPMDE